MYGRNKKIFAMESIAFQDGDFFKDLTEKVKNLRGFDKSKGDKEFFNSKEAKALIACIKEHTNISVELDACSCLAAVYVPMVNSSHVLFDNTNKYIFDLLGIGAESDILEIAKKYKNKEMLGSVDLRNSRVSGVFAEFKQTLLMQRKLFTEGSLLTAAECAAILIHEVGHIFTFFEYSNRSVSTNQSLAIVAKCVDESYSYNTKTMVFDTLYDGSPNYKENKKALLEAKSKEVISAIILKMKYDKTMSNISGSIYDSVTAENLADQFATRHKAGRDLATGLDKVDNGYGMTAGISYFSISANILLFTMVVSSGGMGVIPLSLVIFELFMASNKKHYDDPKSRLTRISYQNTELLKNTKISNKEKAYLIKSNEIIKKLAESFIKIKPFYELLAYYVRPGFRSEKDNELLQKDLEGLAASGLFDKAAKLSLLKP